MRSLLSIPESHRTHWLLVVATKGMQTQHCRQLYRHVLARISSRCVEGKDGEKIVEQKDASIVQVGGVQEEGWGRGNWSSPDKILRRGGAGAMVGKIRAVSPVCYFTDSSDGRSCGRGGTSGMPLERSISQTTIFSVGSDGGSNERRRSRIVQIEGGDIGLKR